MVHFQRASLLADSLLAFTFSSDGNRRLVTTKLRSAVLGRKPGATLQLSSLPPGAKVYLDDQDTGRTTPVTIENVESEIVHDVRLELEGEPALTSTVALVAGTEKSLDLVFPGAIVNLSVKTEPEEAELWMDGRKTSFTPATLDLRVGQPVSLEVRKLGYVSWVKTVTPQRGQDLAYDLTLDKTPELIAQEEAEKAALEAAAAEEAPVKKKRRRRRRR